jgi:hypothetical protein
VSLLNNRHTDLEFNHMNTAYGVELLHTLLAAVRTRAEAAPAQLVSKRTDQPGPDTLRS